MRSGSHWPLLTGFDILITLAYVGLGWTWLVPRDAPLPLLGTGLVVFLGLRNNTAYARWWEARGLWGAVVNQSRNFARTVCAVFPDAGAGALRDQLIVHQIAWAAALRLSLRGENVREGIAGLLSPEEVIRLEGATNVPFAVQREMGRLVTGVAREGRIDSTRFLALNGVMTSSKPSATRTSPRRSAPCSECCAERLVVLVGIVPRAAARRGWRIVTLVGIGLDVAGARGTIALWLPVSLLVAVALRTVVVAAIVGPLALASGVAALHGARGAADGATGQPAIGVADVAPTTLVGVDRRLVELPVGAPAARDQNRAVLADIGAAALVAAGHLGLGDGWKQKCKERHSRKHQTH